MSKYKAMIAGVTILAVPALCSADFSLVDNFESYTVGTYSGGSTAFTANGGPWESNVGGGTGLVSIENDGDNYIAFGWNSGQRGVNRTVTTIADGGAGTYYWQMRTEDGTPDMSVGLSDAATGALGYGDFEIQVSMVGGNLVGRNGGVTDTLATGLGANTWYDIWVTVDNTADTYDVYLGQTDNPSAPGGVLVGDDLGFRNGTANNDLVTFMTMSNNHEDNNANVDNIYYNPVAIPEPATIGLVAVFGAGVMFVRRRFMI